MYDALSVDATMPCGFTEYTLSTFETGRRGRKWLAQASLKYTSDCRWTLFFSESFRSVHQIKTSQSKAEPGETGRQLLARHFDPAIVAKASVYAHAFSRSIDT